MNVLIYTPRAFTIGETFIQNQFIYQNQNNVIGVCHKYQDNGIKVQNKVYKIPAIPINLIDRVKSFFFRKFSEYKYAFPFNSRKQLLKIIEENKTDVIHCNYGHNGLKFIDIVEKTKLPLILHFHGIDASMHLKDESFKNKLPKLFNVAKAIIVVSDDMKDRLLPFVNNKEKIEVIPYGTDLQKILNYPEIKKENKKINILHLGRITPKKGVLDLVKVFKNIISTIKSNVQLDIVGAGEEFDELKKFVENNGLSDKVILHGALQHNQALNVLNKADIFVLNSRVAPNGDREGFPNVIIEAMAAECAIVSTYHAGIPMAITNEKEGLLVEEKNNEQLEKAILRLIENPDERKIFARNAKEKAINNFSVEKMIERYNELYEKAARK